MKKTLAFIFITITLTGYSQNPIEPVVRSYFRMNPFKMKFDHFIAELQKDRWFKVKSYRPRTDSSFLFMEGTYKYFNPFRFIPEKLTFAMVEKELVHLDSHARDTIIYMQLSGITDPGIPNKKVVKKEFNRFHANQTGGLQGYHTYRSFEEKGKIVGELYDYYFFPSVEPITIAWGSLPETNQYTFTLTICFKVKQNVADLVGPPAY
jgi:hypothetical protein